MTDKEKDELLLTQLALMFQTAALQQMGKLRHPAMGAVERDLAQARISIDILDVLHRKMRGNLTDDEQRLFEGVLRDLRLNYVDEASKPQEPAAGAPPPAGGAGAVPAGGVAPPTSPETSA